MLLRRPLRKTSRAPGWNFALTQNKDSRPAFVGFRRGLEVMAGDAAEPGEVFLPCAASSGVASVAGKAAPS